MLAASPAARLSAAALIADLAAMRAPDLVDSQPARLAAARAIVSADVLATFAVGLVRTETEFHQANLRG